MNNTIKYGALAVFIGAGIGNAVADTAETKGGIKVKTDDGRFEATVGGRIHFDAYAFDGDEFAGPGGTEFRRARLTLTGKLYGWDYKFENDFAAQGSASGSGFRDMWVGTKVGPGKLTIGQFKPYRSMEELTSSNEITAMERPFSSATGLYADRQYAQGVGYLLAGDNYTAGLSGFSLRNSAQTLNEGLGAAVRVTYAPIVSDTKTFHLGASYSTENTNLGTTRSGTANERLRANVAFAGRRGPSQSVATVGDGESIDSIGLELAAVLGPFYAQAEYAMADFGQDGGADDVEVNTYYVQASFNVTGESKPYNKATGVFRSVKPKNPSGAVELFVRYDFIEAKDLTFTTVNAGVKDNEATSLIVGSNWYVNPNVRFMLDYTIGEGIFGSTPTFTYDETNQIALRTQLSF